jgi:serine/threonine protein kinase
VQLAQLVGTTLGHYRIAGQLGAGGMGEVYVAEDARLARRVALKVLPPHLSSDPEALRRFEREARALAALNHPSIVTIFSVEQVDDIRFLTMELVEGMTLAQRIPSGGLATEEFVKLALPLCQALSAAHEHGITHRDLKPANIIVNTQHRFSRAFNRHAGITRWGVLVRGSGG